MKVNLLYKNRDFNTEQKMPWNASILMQDLELYTLFNAMAGGDEFLLSVVKNVVLSGLENNVEEIRFRQEILKDCLKNEQIVKEIYAITSETIDKEKKNYWGIFSKYPSSILYRSIEVLEMFSVMLRKLRDVSLKEAGGFQSAGFTTFFEMLKNELDDEFFKTIEEHLKELRFRNGVLVSSSLGKGNKGTGYTLHRPEKNNLKWWERWIVENLFTDSQNSRSEWLRRIHEKQVFGYTFFVYPRDEATLRALSQLKDEGITDVANALAQSNDHILNFLKQLKHELAFYLGCLNLNRHLQLLGEPVVFPVAFSNDEKVHFFEGLYDVTLALTMKKKVVGNDVVASGKDLTIITGANQGGKSTFLRSIGQAQLMMQSGMFVTAGSFSASICSSLFTHFKREEDSAMKSGKLDEELARMDEIINHVEAGSMILFNESFSATNEREGSELARQIVLSLFERRIKQFFVTHQFEFASWFYDLKAVNVLFLRAERQADTSRTFRLVEGEPLKTSFGTDLYNKIFNTKSHEEN